jgi:hypothetical protein
VLVLQLPRALVGRRALRMSATTVRGRRGRGHAYRNRRLWWWLLANVPDAPAARDYDDSVLDDVRTALGRAAHAGTAIAASREAAKRTGEAA